jgi:hypothetical protein
MTKPSPLVQKLWNHFNILRDNACPTATASSDRSPRSNIPLTLIHRDSLGQLVEQQYKSFDSDGLGLLPLTKIYWPNE